MGGGKNSIECDNTILVESFQNSLAFLDLITFCCYSLLEGKMLHFDITIGCHRNDNQVKKKKQKKKN